MAGNFPVKPYADLGSDLEVTWAESRSTTLTCFSNLILTFLLLLDKKCSSKTNRLKNTLDHCKNNLAIL